MTPKPEAPEDTKCLCKEECKENCILDTKETSSVKKSIGINTDTEIAVSNIADTETNNQHLIEENIELKKQNDILKLNVNSLSNDLAFERGNLKDIIKKKSQLSLITKMQQEL